MRVVLRGAPPTAADAARAGRRAPGTPTMGEVPAQTQRAGGVRGGARRRGGEGENAVGHGEPGRLRRRWRPRV
eukprot:4983528-Pleurochrysis_carterae.AAC.1